MNLLTNTAQKIVVVVLLCSCYKYRNEVQQFFRRGEKFAPSRPSTELANQTVADMDSLISWEEVANHNCPDTGLWVVVDSYVLDLTQFLQHHPAGAKKIIDRRNKSLDISSNFLDHFGHTVRAFREACQRHETSKQTVALKFQDIAEEVLIIGKVESMQNSQNSSKFLDRQDHTPTTLS